MRSDAELTQAQADADQAGRDLRAARATLGRQLGRDDFQSLAATGTLAVPSLPPAPDAPDLARSHPRLRAAEADVISSRAALESRRSDYWPTLSANYSRSWQGRSYFPSEPHWSASGVMSWPLFGRGVTASVYGAAAARQDLRRAELSLAAERRDVRNALESAWSELAAAIDAVRVQRQFLAAAQQRNDEAFVRYTTGLMSFENWEQVVGDLVNFEKGVLRAEREAALASAAWERALGKPLEER